MHACNARGLKCACVQIMHGRGYTRYVRHVPTAGYIWKWPSGDCALGSQSEEARVRSPALSSALELTLQL